MRPDRLDARCDNFAIAMVRPAVQRMTGSQSSAFARGKHQAVATEMLERETFAMQLLEHRIHLRALEQRDGNQVMALETGSRWGRFVPAAPWHQLSRPNSTMTVAL